MSGGVKYNLDTVLNMDAIVCYGADAHNKCADQCRNPVQFTDPETKDVGYKCEVDRAAAVLLEVGFAAECFVG